MAKIPHSASHAAIYKTIIKGWFSNERTLRLCLDIIIIILLLILMSWCGEIPFKHVNINLESFGPEYVDMDVLAAFATDTRMDYDPSFQEFSNNGAFGVQMAIHAKGVLSDSVDYYRELLELKDTLRQIIPEEPAVDSPNAVVTMDFDMLFVNSRVGVFRTDNNDAWAWKDTTDNSGNRYFKGKWRKKTYSSRRLGLLKTAKLEGGATMLFKDSVSCTVSSVYRRSEKGWKDIFWDESLWQLCDVSQAYIGIKLNSQQHYRSKNSDGKNTFQNRSSLAWEGNSMKLILEFGSPVTCSNMYPEPDSFTMTSVEFTDPNKIQMIEANGLVFLVKFLHNENIQTAKMFCITSGLSIFLGLLIDKIIKLFFARRRRARVAQIRKTKTEQES